MTIHVKLPASKDLPILYTNGMVVNFVGTQSGGSFLVTPYTIYQEVWSTPGELVKRLERGDGKPLGRFAISSQEWVDTVHGFLQQLDALRTEGVAIPEPTEGLL